MQTHARQLDRLDRYVHRSYVRIGEGVSRYRVESSIEEALRLVELPGEREGRVYFFRCVVLAGLNGQTNRREWMESLQRKLGRLAAEAVHGRDVDAAASSGVYFDSQEQALETLLRQAIRPRPPDWFASAVLGVPLEAGSAAVALATIERLQQSMPMPAVAGIVFAAVKVAGPGAMVRLLDAIPDATARAWVRAQETHDATPGDVVLVELSAWPNDRLFEVARHFGWKDPHTVWLAALAVSGTATTALVSGSVIRKARAILHVLEAKPGGDFGRKAIVASDSRVLFERLLCDRDDEDWASSSPAVMNARNFKFMTPVADALAEQDPERRPVDRVAPEPVNIVNLEDSVGAEADAETETLGEPTCAAGLYFLLHVLRRLGIAGAVEECPALAEASIAAHVLRNIAARLGVVEDDPILLGLGLSDAEFEAPKDLLAAMPRAAWPCNLHWNEARNFTSRTLLRVWTLGVRRWCWREAGLTAREIVERRGMVWMTRTDLDVTLALEDADVRIRRMGLDIDPGWVPWLGVTGRVVRFHYRETDRRAAPNTAKEAE
jgi:hypothetical protein